MIKIDNLTKRYGKTIAVDNLCLHIRKNECVALLGLNGAGKSTTIGVLCSLLKKDGGKITVGGYDLDENENKVKQIVNLSPQETAVAAHLTVKENLQLIAELYGLDNAAERAEQAISAFSLTKKANAYAKTLSGGQKRRLSIAMAMITHPEVLVLDEPTLGLDVRARKELWALIENFKSSTTILLTTHYLEEAVALADRIAVMNTGKLVAFGTQEEILAQTGHNSFEDAFLELAGGEEDA